MDWQPIGDNVIVKLLDAGKTAPKHHICEVVAMGETAFPQLQLAVVREEHVLTKGCLLDAQWLTRPKAISVGDHVLICKALTEQIFPPDGEEGATYFLLRAREIRMRIGGGE